ncbi:MAG TPA: hypothetical protein PKG71_04015 [Candidatus Woesebacteria bacterium]|nr:hypothetical protein [Candidatus Woesebacteria bacterium]HNS95105.1 hypothetical protein [Candidatus Woesebacteria bacterium]
MTERTPIGPVEEDYLPIEVEGMPEHFTVTYLHPSQGFSSNSCLARGADMIIQRTIQAGTLQRALIIAETNTPICAHCNSRYIFQQAPNVDHIDAFEGN